MVLNVFQIFLLHVKNYTTKAGLEHKQNLTLFKTSSTEKSFNNDQSLEDFCFPTDESSAAKREEMAWRFVWESLRDCKRAEDWFKSCSRTGTHISVGFNSSLM